MTCIEGRRVLTIVLAIVLAAGLLPALPGSSGGFVSEDTAGVHAAQKIYVQVTTPDVFDLEDQDLSEEDLFSYTLTNAAGRKLTADASKGTLKGNIRVGDKEGPFISKAENRKLERLEEEDYAYIDRQYEIYGEDFNEEEYQFKRGKYYSSLMADENRLYGSYSIPYSKKVKISLKGRNKTAAVFLDCGKYYIYTEIKGGKVYTFDLSGAPKFKVSGEGMKYLASMGYGAASLKRDNVWEFEGKSKSGFGFELGKNKAKALNLEGIVKIKAGYTYDSDYYGEDDEEEEEEDFIIGRRCYIYSNRVTVPTPKNDNFKASGTAFVPGKSRTQSKPCLLYLRPSNKGKNMFLSWAPVRKAESYEVLKYDEASGEYKRVAVRNGNLRNYYSMEAPAADTPVRYAVAAFTGKDLTGEMIGGKKSVSVHAVSSGSAATNAAHVKITYGSGGTMRYMDMQVGESAKLGGVLKPEKKGKPFYDESVRWYTSNPKVVNVDSMTGEVTAKKKGYADVWAKAHNGRNSKSMTVRVQEAD